MSIAIGPHLLGKRPFEFWTAIGLQHPAPQTAASWQSTERRRHRHWSRWAGGRHRHTWRNIDPGEGEDRSGPIRLNNSPRFLSEVSAATYAARLPVGSIRAYASSGVCRSSLKWGLARLYQSKYCMIDCLASVTESYVCRYSRSSFTDFHRRSTNT